MNMNIPLLVLLAALVIAVPSLFLIRRRRSGARGVLAAAEPVTDRILSGEEEGSLLEHMNEGILVLTKRLRPEFANASARALLGIQEGALPGHVPSAEVGAIAARAFADRSPQEGLVEIWFPHQSTLRVQAIPLDDDPAVLVVLQDASEEIRTQRIRTQFVANASHELKSPVASLQALAEAVREAVPDDPQTAVRFSGRLVDEAERLGKLVSDLLDLSRLEDAGKVREDPVDLSGLAQSEIAQLEATARAEIVALGSSIEPDVWIKGDEHQLAQMIRNLLENAIQYTPPGGRVTLELGRTATETRLRVEDTGVGIPQEAQKRVFERFYRVDQARSREHGGTGLGLAIAKHVAELHGGTIELESELGRGSKFEVHLPAEDELSSKRASKASA
jgi:signal transduction histidine kinase